MSAVVLAVLIAGQSTSAGPLGMAGKAGPGKLGPGDHFYASSERFGYKGTVSVYDTWEDAKSGHNARAGCLGILWPQRDGAIFAVKGAPEYWVDSNIIETNGFANNWGSPSDTNFGFFQLYDENADTWKNHKASWSHDRDTFTVTAKGRNATYGTPPLTNPEDYARLWNACAVQGVGETTSGTFLTYDYKFVATGLNGDEAPKGFITNTTNASDYSGHFRGIFQNESIGSPLSNGFYVFDLQFNNVSWAAENNCGYDGGDPQTVFPCVGLPAYPDQFGGKK
jgi:hypothetical protein